MSHPWTTRHRADYAASRASLQHNRLALVLWYIHLVLAVVSNMLILLGGLVLVAVLLFMSEFALGWKVFLLLMAVAGFSLYASVHLLYARQTLRLRRRYLSLLGGSFFLLLVLAVPATNAPALLRYMAPWLALLTILAFISYWYILAAAAPRTREQ